MDLAHTHLQLPCTKNKLAARWLLHSTQKFAAFCCCRLERGRRVELDDGLLDCCLAAGFLQAVLCRQLSRLPGRVAGLAAQGRASLAGGGGRAWPNPLPVCWVEPGCRCCCAWPPALLELGWSLTTVDRCPAAYLLAALVPWPAEPPSCWPPRGSAGRRLGLAAAPGLLLPIG